MKRLRALLYKEWRDQRLLVVNAAILCVVLLAIVKYFCGRQFDPEIRASYVMPAILAVFAVVLAVESIAREAQSGVETSLHRLPATRAVTWSAKVAFVALASTAFLVLLTGVEHSLRLFEHYSVPTRHSLAVSLSTLPLAAGLAAACFAAACVIRRSLPAAVAGVVALLAIPALAYIIPPSRVTSWLDVALNSWHPVELACMATIAFLLGSFLAFRSRREGAFGLRRAGAAIFGVVVVVGPVLAGTTLHFNWAFDIVPFSKQARISRAEPSLDGRFLAVEAEQSWGPRYEWLPIARTKSGNHCRVRKEVWILDRTTREWNEVDGRCRMIANWPAWDEHGQLLTISWPDGFGDGQYSLERIDPRTRAIAKEHPADLSEALGNWYEWRANKENSRCLTYRRKHVEVRVPFGTVFVPSTQPGIVFEEREGFLVRHDLDSDCTTRLAALPSQGKGFVQVSPDVRQISIGSTILDACDGRILHELPTGTFMYRWSEVDGCVAAVSEGQGLLALLHDDGSLVPLPVSDMTWRECGPDRMVHNDEQHIECMKLDGSEREVLYQARP